MNENISENLDDLITQSEAATLRGVSKASISELIKRGRLKTREMFGKKLVYRSEILSFEKEKPGPKIEDKPEPSLEKTTTEAASGPTKKADTDVAANGARGAKAATQLIVSKKATKRTNGKKVK